GLSLVRRAPVGLLRHGSAAQTRRILPPCAPPPTPEPVASLGARWPHCTSHLPGCQVAWSSDSRAALLTPFFPALIPLLRDCPFRGIAVRSRVRHAACTNAHSRRSEHHPHSCRPADPAARRAPAPAPRRRGVDPDRSGG